MSSSPARSRACGETIAQRGTQETAALRDFDPARDRYGSFASHRYARDARGMSACLLLLNFVPFYLTGAGCCLD